ncbi:hypothetical protein ACV7JQ_06590 [Globicatella sulfidifaciens]
MSGLKLRLNEVKDKFGKLNQVIVIKLKAQWLSGFNLRLNDLLETYSTVRGGQTKRKLFNFLLLVHSLVKLIWIISGKAKKKSRWEVHQSADWPSDTYS